MRIREVLLFVVLFIINSIYSQKKEFQKYNIEKGKLVTITDSKKETKITTKVFKDWGAVELITTETKRYKSKKKKKIAKEEIDIVKFDYDLMFTVDEDQKKILQIKNIAFLMFKNKNLAEEGEKISKFNGGKKLGEEEIMGYPCDIWTLKGMKTWNYKGLALKMEFRGEKMIVKSLDIDKSITDEDLALPDYPIGNFNPLQKDIEYYETEEESKEAAKEMDEKIQNMTWEDWYALHEHDESLDGMTAEQKKAYFEKKKQEEINKKVNERVENRIRNSRIKPIHPPRW